MFRFIPLIVFLILSAVRLDAAVPPPIADQYFYFNSSNNGQRFSQVYSWPLNYIYIRSIPVYANLVINDGGGIITTVTVTAIDGAGNKLPTSGDPRSNSLIRFIKGSKQTWVYFNFPIDKSQLLTKPTDKMVTLKITPIRNGIPAGRTQSITVYRD